MAAKKPVVVKPKMRDKKRKPAAFIRTQMKSAAEDVLGVGFWKRIKTAQAALPHPFLAELAVLPAAFGALGGGLGSLVDDEDAAKRYALTAGLAGLGVALGRGAGAKFLPRASRNLQGLLTGAGLGAGVTASDMLLPEMGYEPVIGNRS